MRSHEQFLVDVVIAEKTKTKTTNSEQFTLFIYALELCLTAPFKCKTELVVYFTESDECDSVWQA